MTSIPLDRTDSRPNAAELGRLDLLLVLMTLGLGLLLLAQMGRPATALLINRDLDIAATAVAAAVAAMAAALQWTRYAESREPSAYLLGSALLILALRSAVHLAAMLLGLEQAFGLSPDAPGQGPVYVFLVTLLFAAILFNLSARAELRRWTNVPAAAQALAFAGAILAIVSWPLGAVLGPAISKVVGPFVLAQPAAGGTVVIQSVAPWFVAAVLLVAAFFMMAARQYRDVYARNGSRWTAFLSIAALIQVFTVLHVAVAPAPYAGMVSGEDVLRLTFYLFLILTFQAEERAVRRDLKESHGRLDALHEVVVIGAVLEERARLAREVHDGLTQELWLAKLRFGEISEAVEAERSELREAVGAVRSAIDSAIAEARLAIVALSVSSEPSADFVTTLQTYIEDVADRLGVPVTMHVAGAVPQLPTRTSAEVIRIVQEALANVRKHADASVATVTITPLDGAVRITVDDDGHGFDPDRQAPGHGLDSMRQRAALIDGELTFERPERGTRLVLQFPLPAHANRS